MLLSCLSRRAAIGTALVFAAYSASVFAATKTYEGPNNGNFAVAASWSPTGLPQEGNPGDDVFLGTFKPASVTTDLDVTINSNVSPSGFGFNSLTLNASALSGFMVINETTGGSVFAKTENIGTGNSKSTFNQTGGSNFADFMNIGVNSGTSSDTYNLSNSGSLSINSGTFGNTSLTVGASGTGTFNQTGGTFDNSGSEILLGANTTGIGLFTFSAGTLSTGFVQVAGGGSGTFTQSGGTLNIAGGNLIVGPTAGGGTGVYNLSGSGIITDPSDGLTSETVVTINSNGTFNDSGGSIKESFTVNFNGTFNLSGAGVIGGSNTINAGGFMNISGGTFAPLSFMDLEGGTMKLTASSTLSGMVGTSGTITSGAGPVTLTLNTPAPGLGLPSVDAFGGVMQNGVGGTLSVTLNGPGGTSSFSGASTYSGTTTIQAGTFLATAANAFSPNSAFVITGGTLDTSTFSQTIASLAGTSGIVNIGAGANLTAGTNNASTTFSGTLTGPGTLIKAGSGTMALGGGGAFTGTIAIQNGSLANSAVNGIPIAANLTFSIGASIAFNFNQSLNSLPTGVLNPVTFANNANLTLGADNSSSSTGGNFTGPGTLTKTGTGTLTIGYGENFANSDSSLTVTVNNGQLTLAKTAGTSAIAGPLNITGGSVFLSTSNEIADTSTVTLTSTGALNLNGNSETIAALAGAGGTVFPNSGTLTINPSITGSYGGNLTGAGTFIKGGAADFTLSGVGSFTGNFSVTTGRLILQGQVAAANYNVSSGATLRFDATAVNLANGSIQAVAGASIEYNNSTVTGGFLRGPGTHTLLAGGTDTLSGVTTFSSTLINQNGSSTFINFTNGGTVNSNASLNFNGGTNAPSGIMNLSSSLFTQDFTNSGVININPGATIINSLSNLFLSGGSRTYIGTKANPGGSITLQGGTTLEVNGALLVNDGTITGTTDVNFGGQAQGIGTYGLVNITFGGIYQPGFASSSIPGNGALVLGLSGSGTIDNVSAGGNMNLTLSGSSSSTFSGPIQNTTGTVSLTIQPAASLTLLTTPLPGGGQSINTYAGGTSIASGGTLLIGATGALPSGGNVQNNGSFIVNANSTVGQITGLGLLSIGAGTTLQIAPNSAVSETAVLTLSGSAGAWTSDLDLSNNKLIVEDSATHAATVTLIKNYVAYGRTHAAGITSSAIPANKTFVVSDNAIGHLTNFGGINNIDTGSILITVAFKGDFNLDGVVDILDLTTVANHWQLSVTDWSQGDFDGNNTVDILDLTAVANNWQAGVGSGGGSSFSDSLAQIGVFKPAITPEPASLFGLSLSILPLLARRRRINRSDARI